jgi:transposase
MQMPKIVNYSVEMTDKIISDYQNGIEISEIADAIGKSVRSVRSKLVREKVYIPQEKTSRSNKVQEPTKKELLNVLEEKVSFPVVGFMGATKESIQDLIDFVDSLES